ncbi:MAG: hypothetical protein CMM67_08955 [Rhodospirillaceae bacterium]|nr:hypothetical protein [Rhodospirillaceae bacterium]OUT77345.1 MAG: hypothetical protein CBB83_09135 [Rhodospirillaceae bacterium TMED23]|tara:strand:+ start:1831 stop:2421 length:591 start_codon:yes stop_codon:yes gene_type:complete
MTMKTTLKESDILDISKYESIRGKFREEIVEEKKLRRIAVGPYATFYFESYNTMWYQVQEMLRIEKGGKAQIKDELAAYNPLIPNGMELVATLMFEIDNPDIRTAFLAGLGGVEEKINMHIGKKIIAAVPEEDVDRTSSKGKASSVQFVHFNFSELEIAEFNRKAEQIVLSINHPKYSHSTTLQKDTLDILAMDFK